MLAVSGGLPKMMDANEDATVDGTAAEVKTSTIDEVSSLGPGKVVSEKTGGEESSVDRDVVVLVIAGEDTEFGRLETSVVVNAPTDWSEFGSVKKVDECTRLETGRPIEVWDEDVLLLELGCVVDLVTKLGDEGSLAALEDVVVWSEPTSVVDGTINDACGELGSELKPLDPVVLSGTIADEEAETLADNWLVDGSKDIDRKEWSLNSAELCGSVAGEDAGDIGDKGYVDDNIDCNVDVGEMLAKSRVVDVVEEKIAELAKDAADTSIFEEAIEGVLKVAEKVI